MIYKIFDGSINTQGFFKEVNLIRQGKKTPLNYIPINFFGVTEQLGTQGELASVAHYIFEKRGSRRIKRDLFFFGVVGGQGCFLSNSKMELEQINNIFNGAEV